MLKPAKNILRQLMFSAGIDLTKNQVYDRLTLEIMKQILAKDSNCIDIGCHKGEMLDIMLRFSPEGKHFGFEPIPEFYAFLSKKYSGNKQVTLISKALSNETGTTEFNWVKNAPAFSGIKERSYLVKNPEIEKIQVELARLDELSEDFPPIRLIKIDVEGAEMLVLEGAEKTIEKHKPYVVFEFGLGASDHYETGPQEMFRYFNEKSYGIHTLKGFLKKDTPASEKEFEKLYTDNIEYYFIAAPKV